MSTPSDVLTPAQLAWWEAWADYDGPIACRTCGRPVEDARRLPGYAVPTCFACLPPPSLLPLASGAER